MLHNLSSFQQYCRRSLVVGDVTAIIGLRAHQDNPWVVERLRMLAGYYDPQPHILVADFGSHGEWQKQLAEICSEANLSYHHVDDQDTFSAACARNLGAAQATTELLFFMDIDCFGEQDLFKRMVALANAINLGGCFDQIINVPLYHLTESTSEQFQEVAKSERSGFLAGALAQASFARPGRIVDYVDPCSNMFLCHRMFFELTGGFNESFRGHGSEDFEFLLRFAVLSQQFPLPSDLGEDHFGPFSEAFFKHRPYKGFRRLFEVMAFQAETAGLRLAHLDHPRPRNTDWHRKNDRDRSRFARQTEGYLSTPYSMLHCDWINRPRRAHTTHREVDALGQLLPLRLAGYHVDGDDLVGPEIHVDVGAAREQSESKSVDSESANMHVVRGILPDSWHYQNGWHRDIPTPAFAEADVSEAQMGVARHYVAALERTRVGKIAHQTCRREFAQSQANGTGEVAFERFVACLIFSRYAFCASSPTGGHDLVYVWNHGNRIATTRAALICPANQRSYVAARLVLNGDENGVGNLAESRLGNRLRKLARNPKRFLRDSRFSSLRWIARNVVK